MTNEQIDALTREQVLELMRKEGLPVVHSFFATIHHRSDVRPDGFTDDDLNEIDEKLEDSDLAGWRKELKGHFEI